MDPLRPYQARTESEIYDRVAAGERRILVVAATGAGKGLLAVHLMNRYAAIGKRALFIAHREELVSQVSHKLTSFGCDHGVIMARAKGRNDVAPIQVASAPTLIAREYAPPADVLLLDEARLHMAAQSQKLLAMYPDKVFIGFDATPIRSDGKGLSELFDEMILMATPRELIDDGFLVDYDGFRYDDPSAELSGALIRNGDFDPRAAAKIMGKPAIVGNVIDKYCEHAFGRRAILFAASVARSKEFVDKFTAIGIPAEHIDDQTPSKKRGAVLDRLRSGETWIVSNVGILAYGTDIPQVEVVILACPTLSVAKFLQQVGRGFRLSPETGKERLLIHDHANLMMSLGLPDEPREWSLHPAVEKQIASTLRTCSRCQQVYLVRMRACPSCPPFEFTGDFAGPDEVTECVEVPLSDMRQAATNEQRTVLRRLSSEARATGAKTGWVVQRFREQYGRVPDWRWLHE